MGGANTLGQHDCAVTACRAEIPSSRLMCVYHWSKLPEWLRAEVQAKWVTWLKYRGTTARAEYEQARDEAVAHIEERV